MSVKLTATPFRPTGVYVLPSESAPPPVGIEWLRVRDEVVAALSKYVIEPPGHYAESSVFRCATSLLRKAADDYALVKPSEQDPREMHYLLISAMVCHGQVVGATEERCTFALWEMLDAYLDGLN